MRYQEWGRRRVFEIRIYLGGMDLFTDGLCCFVTILGVLLACAARGKPCEAWRPMVTPTDQARSREGRVAGIGRGPLALPLPSPPLSPRALARLVRSHAPCAHTPPSKKKEGLRSDSSGRLGPPRCGPRFFLCQGRGSFTLKDDEGR